jgi:hypothetical protein
MAGTAENKTVFVGGGNGTPAVPNEELEKAQDIARRYRCQFVDLHNFQLHHDLFKTISPHLMFRYSFVPLEETEDGRLAIAIADPSQLMMIDEISLLLGKRIITKVATYAQISEILKKTEQSKRVLEDASEGFALDVIREDEAGGEESISIDRLTAQGDISPIIRLAIPPSLPPCSGAPVIFTSRPAMIRCASSSALMACSHRPCRPSPKSTTRPLFLVSR